MSLEPSVFQGFIIECQGHKMLVSYLFVTTEHAAAGWKKLNPEHVYYRGLEDILSYLYLYMFKLT